MEILKPGNIAVFEMHADDAPNMAGGQLWKETDLGHTAHSFMFTDSGAAGIGHVRRAEQLAMMPELGIEQTHFIGDEAGIADSIEELDPATNEQIIGLMVQAALHRFGEAARQGEPYTTIWSFGPDGLTGHHQHKNGFEVAKRVAHKRPEVQQVVTPAMSPKQRQAFIASYGGAYAIQVPEVDTTGYTRLFVSEEGQKRKVAAIEAHRTQMSLDGERSIRRYTSESPPVEYVNIFTRQPSGLFKSERHTRQ